MEKSWNKKKKREKVIEFCYQSHNLTTFAPEFFFFFFFFFFFISEVYPGPIYRLCIKNRSSGQPSITFVSSFIITYIMMGNDMR